MSPVLPVGTFSYSQGLEWAVHCGWVHDEESFQDWLLNQLQTTLTCQELPLLRRLYAACANEDIGRAEYWCEVAVAVRDTYELRKEEYDRAEAYVRVINAVDKPDTYWPRHLFLSSSLFSLSWFSIRHNIDLDSLLNAFAHNWLENSLTAGVKIIPLGQSVAQVVLFNHCEALLNAVACSAHIVDDDIGYSLPALSMASAAHEQQYSRVYRS